MFSVDEIIEQVRALTPSQRRQLQEQLAKLVEADEALAPSTEVIPTAEGAYVLEYIRCGKPNCKCARGELHGPYWYLHRKIGGRTAKRYIGKTRPF